MWSSSSWIKGYYGNDWVNTGKMDQRLNTVVENAWGIFFNQFLNRKYEIEKEAPFQLHFAGVIKLVGELHCLKREELFFIDLESKFVLNENLISVRYV